MDFGAMLLKEVLSNVAEFHTAFRIPNADAPHASLTRVKALLRHRLMAEENDEYLEAANNGDLVEVADALGDQLYILAGTMMRHGMQDVIAKVFREIQASNMSKLGADGQPVLREDGKVLKGPTTSVPTLRPFWKPTPKRVPKPPRPPRWTSWRGVCATNPHPWIDWPTPS